MHKMKMKEVLNMVHRSWAIGKQAIKWASYNLRDWIAKTQTEGDPLYGHDIDLLVQALMEPTRFQLLWTM